MTQFESEASRMLWERALRENKVIYCNGQPVQSIPERFYSREQMGKEEHEPNISYPREIPLQISVTGKSNVPHIPDTLAHRVLEEWEN